MRSAAILAISCMLGSANAFGAVAADAVPTAELGSALPPIESSAVGRTINMTKNQLFPVCFDETKFGHLNDNYTIGNSWTIEEESDNNHCVVIQAIGVGDSDLLLQSNDSSNHTHFFLFHIHVTD